MATSNIVGVDSLIGDESRAALLMSLLGEKALPASELARSLCDAANSQFPSDQDDGRWTRVHESYCRRKRSTIHIRYDLNAAPSFRGATGLIDVVLGTGVDRAFWVLGLFNGAFQRLVHIFYVYVYFVT